MNVFFFLNCYGWSLLRLCFLGFSFNVIGISFNLNSETRACIVFDNVGDLEKEIFFTFCVKKIGLCYYVFISICIYVFEYACNMWVICYTQMGQLLNTIHKGN